MTDRLTCPCCHAEFPWEAGLVTDHERRAQAEALRIPQGLHYLVAQYLGLHRPAKRRGRPDKVARLLRELADAIEAGRVERKGRPWAAPLELWREALETILASRDAGKLDLPLQGHGLLFEIVSRRANSHEARAEQAVEDQRRTHPEGERSERGLMSVEEATRGAWAARMRRYGVDVEDTGDEEAG